MKRWFLDAVAFLLLAPALSVAGTALAQTRTVGGYVLTQAHPMNAMAFGGNYAFTGAPGNYRNGIMEKATRPKTAAARSAKPAIMARSTAT